ncbi:hypothetical protein Ahy_A04g021660 [Arachis hypogaea]|uniref:BED-type domain-containing protein n=1 Tax=Arachis hypogaea TaxID=3818 RepID=A0A445DLH7_ARAHY|nr:hypothetical protein Ahy_A04g021660 [Arachis hypogaea]
MQRRIKPRWSLPRFSSTQCLPSSLLQFRVSFKPPVAVTPPPLNSSLPSSQLVESSVSSQHRSSLCHLLLTLSSHVVLYLLPPVLAFTTFAAAIAAYNSAISAHFLLPEHFPVLRASSLPYQLTAPALALLLIFRTEASYARLVLRFQIMLFGIKLEKLNVSVNSFQSLVFSNYFMASNAREDTQSNSVAPNDNEVEVQSNANPTSETPQATDNVSTPEGSTPNEGDNKTHVKSAYREYFDHLKVEGEWKAKCKFCKTVLSANPRNGTKSLRNYVDRYCKRIKVANSRQSSIVESLGESGWGGYSQGRGSSSAIYYPRVVMGAGCILITGRRGGVG